MLSYFGRDFGGPEEDEAGDELMEQEDNEDSFCRESLPVIPVNECDLVVRFVGVTGKYLDSLAIEHVLVP